MNEFLGSTLGLATNLFSALKDNVTSLIIGGALTVSGVCLARIFHRKSLAKGFLNSGNTVLSTTDYYPSPKQNQKGERYYDQFIDTKGRFELTDIFAGSSGSVVLPFIKAARRQIQYGTANRAKLPLSVLLQMLKHTLKRESDHQETDVNLLLTAGNIIDNKFKNDSKTATALKIEMARQLINFVRTNIDTTDGIFRGTPLPQNVEKTKLISYDAAAHEETARPVLRNVFPVLVFEKDAGLSQYRLFLTRDFELESGYLPPKQQVRVWKGSGDFEFAPDNHLMQRHNTVERIIRDLNSGGLWVHDDTLPGGGKTLRDSLTVALKDQDYAILVPST